MWYLSVLLSLCQVIGPDNVQGCESDKKVFLDKVWAPKFWKADFFQKLGLALGLGLGLGLAFQGVNMSTFDEPDHRVSRVGKRMKKCFLDNVFGLKRGKSRLFSKAGLALGLGLGLGWAFEGVKMFTFDGPDGVQGWESAGTKT